MNPILVCYEGRSDAPRPAVPLTVPSGVAGGALRLVDVEELLGLGLAELGVLDSAVARERERRDVKLLGRERCRVGSLRQDLECKLERCRQVHRAFLVLLLEQRRCRLLVGTNTRGLSEGER